MSYLLIVLLVVIAVSLILTLIGLHKAPLMPDDYGEDLTDVFKVENDEQETND